MDANVSVRVVCCMRMMFNDAVIAFSSQSDSAVILTGGLYYQSGSVLGQRNPLLILHPMDACTLFLLTALTHLNQHF